MVAADGVIVFLPLLQSLADVGSEGGGGRSGRTGSGQDQSIRLRTEGTCLFAGG